MNLTWKHFAPVVVAIVIALIPAPAGLPQYAWYYFAIFVGVIVGLMFEPLPGGAIGLIGVTLVTVLNTSSSARSSWRRPASIRPAPL